MSDAMRKFPTVRWEDRRITFTTDPAAPDGYAAAAVVVFALQAGRFVLADIAGRGWTTPSGGIEPGETPEEAAVRETCEEIGAEAEGLRQIGGFAMAMDDGRRLWAPAFVCAVRDFGAIPAGSESRGAMAAEADEVERRYYRWDAMLASAFRCAALAARDA